MRDLARGMTNERRGRYALLSASSVCGEGSGMMSAIDSPSPPPSSSPPSSPLCAAISVSMSSAILHRRFSSSYIACVSSYLCRSDVSGLIAESFTTKKKLSRNTGPSCRMMRAMSIAITHVLPVTLLSRNSSEMKSVKKIWYWVYSCE